VTDSHIALFPD